MELTLEQQEIIHSSGDIKINAVAGSGKTTTVIEYARTRPKKSRILYLAFNKSVKVEAMDKFRKLGLNNVRVETAHSLAYRHIVPAFQYKIKQHGYKVHEIVSALGLEGRGEKHAEYVLANHINSFLSYFCNSSVRKVQQLNYLEVLHDPGALDFIITRYDELEYLTRVFLQKMNKGEIGITHDFYLKKFQLAEPQLPFDYILFDEGQDASPAMLDVFFKQKATKVIVGDTHQQIYGWRYAVNSLEQAEFHALQLTNSFRFSQHIADLAIDVLKWKLHLQDKLHVSISGRNTTLQKRSQHPGSHAVIARTNVGLLLKAIEYITDNRKAQHIYFEGNIHSYTYADDGASLYDVLHLKNGKRKKIRDKLLQNMKDLKELEEYIEKTGDGQLGMMLRIVDQYGNEIPAIIASLKEKHVGDEEKAKAERIFSTVHRCKGMEYDCVHLANDFINEETLYRMLHGEEDKTPDPAKLNEEINLLYVAITRTKAYLDIPETIAPVGHSSSRQIKIVKESDKETVHSLGVEPTSSKKSRSSSATSSNKGSKNGKAHQVDEARKQHRQAYMPWTQALDKELTEMYCEGFSVMEMAKHFERTKGAIMSRIEKLELEELYG